MLAYERLSENRRDGAAGGDKLAEEAVPQRASDGRYNEGRDRGGDQADVLVAPINDLDDKVEQVAKEVEVRARKSGE
eukprot:scaffold25721_cov63-Phaeocystis_antarctica.AAC.5